MSNSAGPTPEVAAPRRKPRRRWARRILVALLILIALVAVVTQVVLWTDFPRKLVLGLVEKELGLRVEAASLSTGWLGHTTLRDVRLSLPLKADEAFFDVRPV